LKERGDGVAHVDEFAEIEIKKIRPYEKNAKVHSAEQIAKIADSIKHFGFVSPCLVDHDLNLIAGHGRMEAAKKLKMKTVPCVFVEGLTDAERRAYILADNKLADLGSWDQSLVSTELFDLGDAGIDMSLFGFDHFWEAEGQSNEAYDDFLDKFDTPLTTDDCYTPEKVYNAVRKWTIEHYDLGDAQVVRPFYPGGDYENEKYPAGCVVIDNPPFSILSKIVKFYMQKQIRFLLFAPGLTLFSIAAGGCNYIPCGVTVTYENGAEVFTSFVTNMGEYKIDTAPELFRLVEEANEASLGSKELPAYKYPDEVLTPATLTKYVKNGADIKIRADESQFIRKLDAQSDKAIYGGGFLISKAAAEKAAAEKAAAEKAAAEKEKTRWELSKREQEIVERLGE
jgi:ParB-like chromosome segregation protein Spo0J